MTKPKHLLENSDKIPHTRIFCQKNETFNKSGKLVFSNKFKTNRCICPIFHIHLVTKSRKTKYKILSRHYTALLLSSMQSVFLVGALVKRDWMKLADFDGSQSQHQSMTLSLKSVHTPKHTVYRYRLVRENVMASVSLQCLRWESFSVKLHTVTEKRRKSPVQ